MTALLADRLTQARRHRFVGRQAELELFRAALSRELPDFAVLHLYGPGGMGKTTLMREFAQITAEASRPYLFLDGRRLDPSPDGFSTALQVALNLPPEDSPHDALATMPNLVLFIDTYELMAPLDDWLREQFLPQMPERAVVVIAGRQPPPAAWRADDGWGELTRIISLRNLRPEESAAYLRAQGVPEAQIEPILNATYGHPLALSLAADLFNQNKAITLFDLKQDPDIVRVLLERFVAEEPSAVFRQALEICAHVFTTDEDFLAYCLGEENARAAFQWLRDLSFIEQGPFGLFPHDLAREALEADLRWRNPARFREAHFQTRGRIIQQIRERHGAAQQAAVFSLLFLHRNNPFMRPYYEWQSFGQLYVDQAQPADIPVIEQLICRYQGEESLAATRYWYGRPESTFYVFRAAGQALAGFGHVLTISQPQPDDMAADPALRAAVAYLQTNAPLREGDVILHFCNWMGADDYQLSPAIFNMGAMIFLRLLFETPRLAYSFVAETNFDYYAGMYEYLRMPMVAAAGFVFDGQRFNVFAHDWRAEPVWEWLDIMGERELLDEIVALESLPLSSQPVALSEPEFAGAARQALKDMRAPDLLARNPLLRSRCLRDQAGAEATPAHLQALLREGAAFLAANAKTQKLHRVLWHTYFEPAPTQEAAAELLDLPFSTYRYQLGKALERLIGWLWQRELYGVEP
jgi:hypothetical protein